jgi:signal transduction histidine kinase
MQGRLEERLAERERIARDLHDTLLQSFHALILRFEVVNRQLPAGKAKEALEQTLEQADRAIAEGRSAVYDLRASATDSGDLSEALNAAGNEFSGDHGAAFNLTVEGPVRELQPIVRDELYRIVREALSNAFNHARAHKIEAEITYAERLLRIRVRDDGTGISSAILEDGRPGHYGLPGMRERAAKLGATLNIWSRPETGCEIELSILGSIAYLTSPGRSRFRWFHREAGSL